MESKKIKIHSYLLITQKLELGLPPSISGYFSYLYSQNNKFLSMDEIVQNSKQRFQFVVMFWSSILYKYSIFTNRVEDSNGPVLVLFSS